MKLRPCTLNMIHPRRIRRLKSRAWDLAAILYSLALVLMVAALGWVALAM